MSFQMSSEVAELPAYFLMSAEMARTAPWGAVLVPRSLLIAALILSLLAFPKRKGWLRRALFKLQPGTVSEARKLPFVDQPVRTRPSVLLGYKAESQYDWTEPKEWPTWTILS